MEQEFLVIRHAESLYNVKLSSNLNSDLTPVGEQQAVLTGEYLKKSFPELPLWQCIVSPFKRTLQTARIIQKIIGVNFKIDQRIREYTPKYPDFYILNLKDEFPEFNWDNQPSEFFIAKEPNDKFRERIREYLKELSGKCLLVSHSTPCRTMTKMLLGIDEDPDGQEVKNCGISHIVNSYVKMYNHVAY